MTNVAGFYHAFCPKQGDPVLLLTRHFVELQAVLADVVQARDVGHLLIEQIPSFPDKHTTMITSEEIETAELADVTCNSIIKKNMVTAYRVPQTSQYRVSDSTLQTCRQVKSMSNSLCYRFQFFYEALGSPRYDLVQNVVEGKHLFLHVLVTRHHQL